MLDDLAEFFALREEKLKLGRTRLVVRELDGAVDWSTILEGDRVWKMVVRCVFREDTGEPAFSDEDVPKLKRKSPVYTAPLVNAVNRVNGLAAEEEVKNSEAAPGSAS